jgi:hypothetical protein
MRKDQIETVKFLIKQEIALALEKFKMELKAESAGSPISAQTAIKTDGEGEKDKCHRQSGDGCL